jgi:hypothetical protein
VTARACTKVAYPSHAAALVALGRLKASGVRRAYRCNLPGCRAWHLTSRTWSAR